MGACCMKHSSFFPSEGEGHGDRAPPSAAGCQPRAGGSCALRGELCVGHAAAPAPGKCGPAGCWRRPGSCEPHGVLEEAVCPQHGSELPAQQLGPRSPVLLVPGQSSDPVGRPQGVLLVHGAVRSRGCAAGLSQEAAGFQKLKANQNGQKAWKASKNYK